MPGERLPLSLYVHLPWCIRKCPYCDFNSHKAGDNPPRERYITALIADLKLEAAKAGGREIISVFLGGGTPSLFSPAEIEKILRDGLKHMNVSDDCEVTMEANPGSLERGELAGYRAAGVNRLSIGGQSFNSQILKTLGRIHGPAEIISAYDEASAAGFNSINIDLMFALPQQDLQLAVDDINALLELSPPHVSYYHLTLEPNTVFYQRPPADIPDDSLSWEIQTTCHALLLDAGYGQYEISAFAKPGHECRHNLNYWRFGDYLAAGCGAHGKLSGADGEVTRYTKPANPLSYMEQASTGQVAEDSREPSPEDLKFEYMLNVLRLNEGFCEQDFAARTGLPAAAIGDDLVSAEHAGLVRGENGHWRVTATGFRFLNDLQARFLP